MFRTVLLSIIRSFSLYTQQWYMPYRFSDRCQLDSTTSGVLNGPPTLRSNKQSTGAAPGQTHAHISICLLIIIFRSDISGAWCRTPEIIHESILSPFPTHINFLVARTVTIKNKVWDRHWGYLQCSALVAWWSQTSFLLKCSRVGWYSITVNAYCVCSWINYQCAVNMDVDVLSSCQELRERTSLVCWLASSE